MQFLGSGSACSDPAITFAYHRVRGILLPLRAYEPASYFERIGGARRQNWVEQWTAARPYVAQILGSKAAADALTTASRG